MHKLHTKITKQKIEYVVNSQLPTFAGRYFKDSINALSESSLYGNALDLASFFQYLNNSHGVDIKQMSIKDLDKISSYDIENYLKVSFPSTIHFKAYRKLFHLHKYNNHTYDMFH